jgi:hypothetical protein
VIYRLPLLAALFCAFCASASAEEIDLWNLRGTAPVNMATQNLQTVQSLKEGLYIRSDTEGYLVWTDKPLDKRVDVITLRIRSGTNLDASFIWQPAYKSDADFFQLPLRIPASEFARDVNILVNNFPQWEWQTGTLGIRFPAGTTVIIEEVQLRRWNMFEKTIEAFKSFWVFDDFTGYSINFMWGPLIATNTPARLAMFDTIPPFAWSAVRIFYAVLAIAAVVALVFKFWRKDTALAAGIFAGTFAILWLIFDVRMSAELLSYAHDDIKHFVLADEDERSLRTFETMYTITDRAAEVVKKYDRYALLAPGGRAVIPVMRYSAYPAVPVYEGGDMTGVRMYAVFDSSITIDEQGQLGRNAQDGRKILSPPGKTIMNFGDGYFLFETSQ